MLAIVATLAAGVGSVAWFARNTWWVKADRGEVTIFQGPPDGLLWIDAISKGQKILVADIADEGLRKDVERGIEYDSLESAQSYVDDLARQVTTSTVTSTTTSTTTSSPTATSAAAPTEPAPAEPAPTGAGATPPSGPGA